MYRAFNVIDDIVCVVGDTLPTMTVTVNEMRASYTMQCRIFSLQYRRQVLSKECTSTSTGFTVQLTSTDMAAVPVGSYWIDFVLSDTSGNLYKKLRGKLIVMEG